MKEYSVLIPIAGHLAFTIIADSEDDAIEKAFASDYTIDNIDDWDAVEAFNRGNVCYCPQPWEAEATLIFDDGEADDAQGMIAGTAKTEGLGATPASPVGNADAPERLPPTPAMGDA